MRVPTILPPHSNSPAKRLVTIEFIHSTSDHERLPSRCSENPPLSPFEKKGNFLQPVLIPHDPIALPLFEKEGLGEICVRRAYPQLWNSSIGSMGFAIIQSSSGAGT